jgi:hypothetical protein
VVEAGLNIGQILHGDRIVSTPMVVGFCFRVVCAWFSLIAIVKQVGVLEPDTIVHVCNVTLGQTDRNVLRARIAEEYYIE